MRKILTFISLMIFTFVLTSCNSKIQTPLTLGSYKTQKDETHQLGENFNIEEINVNLSKISKEEFDSANNKNVMEDLSYSNDGKRYLSFILKIKLVNEETKDCEILYKKPTQGSAPATYYFEASYPEEEGNITIFIELKEWHNNKLTFTLTTIDENVYAGPIILYLK